MGAHSGRVGGSDRPWQPVCRQEPKMSTIIFSTYNNVGVLVQEWERALMVLRNGPMKLVSRE